ncbi:uncharacterized protein LOC126788246 [Argentina anserina]|uniref:uncharacterized protein LOC126788246 n=1 Tax=Argentina anserina TaxID=57926 RepID=UPI0021765195|nr:uncharacterized protein LOC126788246 [Potentilla anserina]
MGFFSFFGRVLFAAVFMLSAWQAFNELGTDGGPAAKELVPKFSVIKDHLSSKLGFAIPDVEPSLLVMTVIAFKALGGILFVLNSNIGALLLILQLSFTTPLIYDFYNFSPDTPKFHLLLIDFLQQAALVGALFFFIGMKNSITKRGQVTKKKIHKTKTG